MTQHLTPYDLDIVRLQKRDPGMGYPQAALEHKAEGYRRALADMQPQLDAQAATIKALVEAVQLTLQMMEEHGLTHETKGPEEYDEHILDQYDTGHSSALSDVLRSVLALAKETPASQP